ncbi:MAG TPA: MotA/TolQ/ExbB proton channel family protein [Gemmataceae bacterium]|nr:MotA/TolQ/ExbB proton channel family protein [Gemmataceae bacterium]
MTPSQPAADAPSAAGMPHSRVMRGALLLGLPLAVGVLVLLHSAPFDGSLAQRYVSHPVEWAEVVLFFCALIALAAKLGQSFRERRVGRTAILPAWDGRPVAAAAAEELLAGLGRLPRCLRGTWLVRRVRAVLEFVRRRPSAAGLDDQLRALADNDALAVENSYSLVRFICWAIPILGFLGTVLGITEAVAGVTPEILEQSLDKVTGGLAVAFDTTALALALTMILMFLTFLAERAEGAVLESVDAYVERELAHRFERTAGEGSGVVETVRQDIRALLQATEQLVQRQAEIWVRTFEEMEKRRADAERQRQERLTAALEEALQRTLASHAERLAALEKQAVERGSGLLRQLAAVADAVRAAGHEQQQALTRVAEGIMAQADVLGRLQDGERQLLQAQELLNQNLAAIAGVGTFEQAVHSLTAAVHLLSAVAVQGSSARAPVRRAGPQEEAGKAA